MLDKCFTSKTHLQCFLYCFYSGTVSYEVDLLYSPGSLWTWITSQVAGVTVWHTRSSQTMNSSDRSTNLLLRQRHLPTLIFFLINNFSSYCLELLCIMNWDPCLTRVGISRKEVGVLTKVGISGCMTAALGPVLYFSWYNHIHPVLAFPMTDFYASLLLESHVPSSFSSFDMFSFSNARWPQNSQ